VEYSSAVPLDLEQLEREVNTLQEALQSTRRQESEVEAVLTDLEKRQQEALTKANLARQAGRQYEERLSELLSTLEKARLEAATSAFDDAVAERDELARFAVEAIGKTLIGIEQLDESRARLAAMQDDLATRGVKVTIGDDPQEFLEAWETLVTRVRETLQERLEDEMVEAAVYSSLSRAIEELPVHLQELARQRRKRAQQQAAARAYSEESSPRS
jgi:chromosome segregation ATPase